ncbi:MAG TPA: dihydroneopterin aldolase [Balneolaceae bacterium]|nr:dihydroneopterin aldolase [Balneolaceae bacterium]
MDTLTLRSLQFRGNHGYYERERREGNDFEVDLIFTADLRPAGNSDQLSDTIDYQQAVDIVASVMNGPPVKLIERLAKKVGDALFEAFSEIQKLEVSVRKLQPPLDIKTAYSEIRMTWPQ